MMSQLAITFASGQTCVIQGLSSRRDLNGQTCTIVELDPKTSRWVIRLDTGNVLKLKEENLSPLDAAAAGAGTGAGQDDMSAERAKLDKMLADNTPAEPRHVVDGIFSGLGVAVAGVGAGIVGLVAAPIAGAQ